MRPVPPPALGQRIRHLDNQAAVGAASVPSVLWYGSGTVLHPNIRERRRILISFNLCLPLIFGGSPRLAGESDKSKTHLIQLRHLLAAQRLSHGTALRGTVRLL